MGQNEVYTFLRDEYKKNPNKWFISRDIAKEIGGSLGSTTNACYNLWKHNEVERKLVKQFYFYRWLPENEQYKKKIEAKRWI